MINLMRPTKELTNGLIDLISDIDIEVNNMIEVGSYIGESSVIFSRNLPNSTIYCVDPFISGYDVSKAANVNFNEVEQKFLSNTKDCDNIIHIKKKSIESLDQFGDKIIDFVYIDGCHKYDCVYDDIKELKNIIREGGYIGLHDYDNENVKKAINELLGTPDKVYSDNSVLFKL